MKLLPLHTFDTPGKVPGKVSFCENFQGVIRGGAICPEESVSLGASQPIRVGPPTPGGPISAVFGGYYNPVTMEFNHPMPDYNPEAYNCHSLAWHDAKGDPEDSRNYPHWKRWDNYPDDNIAEKGYRMRDEGESCKVGDRAIYWDDGNRNNVMEPEEIRHSAIVVSVDSAGTPTLLAGKWGEAGTFVHGPREVPSIYGKKITYYENTNPDRKPVITKRQLRDMLGYGERTSIDNSNPEQYLNYPLRFDGFLLTGRNQRVKS